MTLHQLLSVQHCLQVLTMPSNMYYKNS